jgi:hypothetical protein
MRSPEEVQKMNRRTVIIGGRLLKKKVFMESPRRCRGDPPQRGGLSIAMNVVGGSLQGNCKTARENTVPLPFLQISPECETGARAPTACGILLTGPT